MSEHLFNKLPGLQPQTLLKKDPDKGVLPRILRTFSDQVVCRTPANGCF